MGSSGGSQDERPVRDSFPAGPLSLASEPGRKGPQLCVAFIKGSVGPGARVASFHPQGTSTSQAAGQVGQDRGLMDWQLWALGVVALGSGVGILTAMARSWGTGERGTFERPHGQGEGQRQGDVPRGNLCTDSNNGVTIHRNM